MKIVNKSELIESLKARKLLLITNLFSITGNCDIDEDAMFRITNIDLAIRGLEEKYGLEMSYDDLKEYYDDFLAVIESLGEEPPFDEVVAPD